MSTHHASEKARQPSSGGSARFRVDLEVIMLGVLGVAVRLRQYVFGRSLWVDEALVANDLAELSVIDSLTERSPRNQLAPGGFWIVSHAADAISSDELMLRLVPLLAGVALVAVTVVYASRQLDHRLSRLLLVTLIALSPSLIYYSAEVKQYGIEALLAMIAIVAVSERALLSRTHIVALALLMLAFSIPSLLIVPVLGLLWLVSEVRKLGFAAALRYLSPPGAVIFSAWAVALIWAQLAKPGIMQGFWSDAFAPLPIGAAEVGWWIRNAVGLSHLSLSNLGVPLHTENPAWNTAGARLVALALFGLILIGVIRVAAAVRSGPDQRGRPAVSHWLAAVPAILALGLAFTVASVLEIYPFRGRLIMVLVPLVAVAAAHGLDVALDRQLSPDTAIGRVRQGLAVVAAAVIAIAAGQSGYSLATDPYDRWDIEPAIQWIAANSQTNDAVVAYCLSDQQLQYYRSHLDERGVIAGPCLTTLSVDAVLERAAGERMWFLHGHIRADGATAEVIADHPSVVSTFRSDGVIAVLLDPQSIEG